nr:hypothetical protein [Escherichia coli]
MAQQRQDRRGEVQAATASATGLACFIFRFLRRPLQALVSSPDEIKNLYRRCRNGYEKLQVFRLLELDQDHPVIRKFVNETYHIENEFICQLDPSRFDLIPEYVIMECDKLIALPPAANQSSVARIA